MAEFTKVPETSRLPVVAPKAKKGAGSSHSFATIQRQLEVNWDESLEMPQYSPVMANRAAANLLGVSTPQATSTDTASVGAEGTTTVQRACAECAEEQEADEEKPQIQTKLAIGQTGDKYEQEADEVARQVVDQIHASPSLGINNEAGATLQRQEVPATPVAANITLMRQETGATAEASTDVEDRIQRSRGQGQPLGNTVQAPMEQAFGSDFSGVRIHTDGESDELNQAVQAKAFTTGQDIYFRSGAYEPESPRGQELLAHELTHVMQQSEVIRRDITAEREWFEQHPEPRYTESGNTLILWNFPVNETQVQPPHRQALEEFIEHNSLHFLVEGARVEVVGCASESGSTSLNDTLSYQRAAAVRGIVHRLRPRARISHYGVGLVVGSDPENMARNRSVEITLPPFQRPPVTERESRWRQARTILEELVGDIVGGDADLMWTPTTNAIVRMMPAIPLFERTPQAGQDVPRGELESSRPASQHMPTPHHETVRILGEMLERTFYRQRMLSDEMIRQTVVRFLEYGRAAKRRREQRLISLQIATSQGGGSMIQDELAAYQNAERAYFQGDPTCIWRYL